MDIFPGMKTGSFWGYAALAAAAGFCPAAAWGAGGIIFEFRDAGGDLFGGPNETEVVRGGSFSMEAWLHAGGTDVAGVNFKARFDQYPVVLPWKLTLVSVSHAGSDFSFVTHPSIGIEPLIPSNSSDLGAFVDPDDPVDSRNGSEFLALLTLAVDGGLPKGTYTVSPEPFFTTWVDPVEGGEWSFDGLTSYTIHVVPEPKDWAGAAALALLGFATYRRLRARG